MTDNQNITDPNLEYIDQLLAEANSIESEEERLHHFSLIAELTGTVAARDSAEVEFGNSEIDTAEQAQAAADESIRLARQLARTGNKKKDDNIPKVSVDLDKIGWIDDQGPIEITTEDVKTKELNYLLVNLIDMNTTTKANYGKLTDQSAEGTSNLGEKLLDLVKQEKIPILHKDILKRSSSLRPIAISGKKLKDVDPEQSLNTSYPAYKIDVQGSNNRAIILKLENTSEGMPVYAVVAIYDHDDDKAIHKNLFLKQKKNK